MFEQPDETKKTPRVSIVMSLAILAAYLIGAYGGLTLFLVLGDRPYGTQIATATVYTYFAFWYIFFPTRGLLQKYSLRDARVQQEIPLLLAIHCAFLILCFLGQSLWLPMKPRLPSYWSMETGRRDVSLYGWVSMGSAFILFFTQVLISRRILSRAMKIDEDESGLG